MNKTIIKHKLKSQYGIGLVEVIAALGISIVILTSLVSLSIFTLRSSLTSKLLLQGTNLANEELERMRAKRDSSATWQAFVDSVYKTSAPVINCSTNNCNINSSLVVAQGNNTIGSGASQLTRYFRISDPLGGSIDGTESVIRVSVTVSWNIAGQTKYANVYTDLSNWMGK